MLGTSLGTRTPAFPTSKCTAGWWESSSTIMSGPVPTIPSLLAPASPGPLAGAMGTATQPQPKVAPQHMLQDPYVIATLQRLIFHYLSLGCSCSAFPCFCFPVPSPHLSPSLYSYQGQGRRMGAQGALPKTCLGPETWVQRSTNQTPNEVTQDQPGSQSQPQATSTTAPEAAPILQAGGDRESRTSGPSA